MRSRQEDAFAARWSRSRKRCATRTRSTSVWDAIATVVEIALITLTFTGILPAALACLVLSLPAWAAVFFMVGVGVLAVAYAIGVRE